MIMELRNEMQKNIENMNAMNTMVKDAKEENSRFMSIISRCDPEEDASFNEQLNETMDPMIIFDTFVKNIKQN